MRIARIQSVKFRQAAVTNAHGPVIGPQNRKLPWPIAVRVSPRKSNLGLLGNLRLGYVACPQYAIDTSACVSRGGKVVNGPPPCNTATCVMPTVKPVARVPVPVKPTPLPVVAPGPSIGATIGTNVAQVESGVATGLNSVFAVLEAVPWYIWLAGIGGGVWLWVRSTKPKRRSTKH